MDVLDTGVELIDAVVRGRVDVVVAGLELCLAVAETCLIRGWDIVAEDAEELLDVFDALKRRLLVSLDVIMQWLRWVQKIKTNQNVANRLLRTNTSLVQFVWI